MGALYMGKCGNKIQEQKEIPVQYTGICSPISSTEYISLHMFIFEDDFHNNTSVLIQRS